MKDTLFNYKKTYGAQFPSPSRENLSPLHHNPSPQACTPVSWQADGNGPADVAARIKPLILTSMPYLELHQMYIIVLS